MLRCPASRAPDSIPDPDMASHLTGTASDASRRACSSPDAVAGLGVLAGGEGACRTFLAALSGDSGIAYILIDSQASGDAAERIAALESHCALPCLAIEPGAALVPDAVHVAPFGSRISFQGGRFELARSEPSAAGRLAEAFASIASAFGARGACVAFGDSGDGSEMLAALRAAIDSGGAAFAASADAGGVWKDAPGIRFLLPDRLPEALRAHAQKARAAADGSSADLRRAMQRAILEQFSPKGVVVDAGGLTLCAADGIEKFLAEPAAPLGSDLVEMARPELRSGLRSVLRDAARTNAPASCEVSPAKPGDARARLTAQPMPEAGEGERRFLVVFQSLGPSEAGGAAEASGFGTSEARLRQRERMLEILNDLSAKLAGELELDALMQAVADAGRVLAGAEFGAFYYLVEGESGNGRALCRFSGTAGGEAKVPGLEPIAGGGDARWDDVTLDERCGPSVREFGISKGALPIRSYVSSSVLGRDGRVVGALRYGHSAPGAFDSESEAGLRGLAAQAAVAMENARLYAALRESEQRNRHLLHTGHDAVFVYPILEDGTPGALIDVNEQAVKALGYSREELLQMTVCDFVTSPEGKTEEVFQRFREQGSAMMQTTHRKKDGSLLPVEVSVTLVQLDGRPHVISKARAIADRLRAEEELRRSERLHRAIGESIRYGIWICDAEGRCVYASQSFLDLLGITQQQCSELGWTEALHPSEREATVAAWKARVAGGEPWEREHRLLGVDGKYHSVLARGIPIRDDAGKVVQWAGINLDIGRLKATEDALRASESRFRAYFESSPIPLMEQDWSEAKREIDRIAALYPDLETALLEKPELAQRCLEKARILDANPAAVELYRAAGRDDLIAQARRVVGNRSPQARARMLLAIREGSGRFSHEEETRAFDGAKRYALCEFVALPGHEQTLDRALVSRVDITASKRAQEAASLLAAVGSEMASALLHDETLSNLARAVVPGLADWCAVDLLQPDGSLRRVVTTHADPEKQALALRVFEQRGPDLDDRYGLEKALKTRRTEWAANAEPPRASASASDAEQARLLETLGLRSYICVPLAARGELFGAITFAAGESGRRYDEQDVALAREFGRHASQAIDTARLYRRQIDALQEAKETQALLDTVIANAPVGMALLDRELRFVHANKILAAMNDLDAERGRGASLREALPDLWPSLLPECERVLRGEAEVARLELRRGAEERPEDARFFDYTLYAVRSASAEVVGVGVIAQEVTENKRFEASLAFAREQAEAANQSKSEFLANMSHEIRTPMTSIIGYASILGQQLEDPEQIECVNTIRRNGEFLTEIINDILDLSRIEAGRLQIDLKPTNPRELIAEVMSLMRVRGQEKQLALESSFSGLLPETIETDPVRLRQVLVNLMGNAIKFTESGGVRLEARLLAEEERLECRVVDTGIGMSEDQLGRIFQPFEQADTSVSRRFGGSGLGLTICKRLVQMLGGEIGATSELGMGSVFTFSVRTGALEGVPLVDPGEIASPARREVARRAVSLDCRALVVDDRQEIRQLAKRYVEDAGGQVSVASDGARCLEEVRRADEEGRPFDVVVLDVQMPVMDGFEAVRRLRGLGFDKPVIAMTAHAMKGDREKLLQAGCDDCATKPIDQAKFIELIASHVHPRGAGPAEEPARPKPSVELKPTPGSGRKGKRLLIVEDDFSLRRILSIAFEQRGHETQVASTGEDAIEIARAFKPDVALVDLGLPDMTGHDLAQLLRDMPELKDTKLFALSGRDRPEDIRRSQQVGFRRHIVKPPDIEEVEKYFYE